MEGVANLLFPSTSSREKPPITINAFASTITDESIDRQTSCPLFTTIPTELRTYIFNLALQPYDDHSKPWPVGTYYYRPYFEYETKIWTALLRTCRRIYLETHLMIFTLNEFCAWGCSRERGPALGHNKSLMRLVRLNAEQQSLLSVHFFLQQYWQDHPPFFKAIVVAPAFNFGTIHITLRHTDWWYWERRDALSLNPGIGESGWGDAICQAKGLHTFILELETLNYKRDELDAIVQRTGSWEFRQKDSAVLLLDESAIRYSTWLGPQEYEESSRVPDWERRHRPWHSRPSCNCGWDAEGKLQWCDLVAIHQHEHTGLDQEGFKSFEWPATNGNTEHGAEQTQQADDVNASTSHQSPRRPDGLPESAIPKQVTEVKLLNWQREGSSILQEKQEHVVAKLVWRKKFAGVGTSSS